jgi:hypothetical protein
MIPGTYNVHRNSVCRNTNLVFLVVLRIPSFIPEMKPADISGIKRGNI